MTTVEVDYEIEIKNFIQVHNLDNYFLQMLQIWLDKNPELRTSIELWENLAQTLHTAGKIEYANLARKQANAIYQKEQPIELPTSQELFTEINEFISSWELKTKSSLPELDTVFDELDEVQKSDSFFLWMTLYIHFKKLNILNRKVKKELTNKVTESAKDDRYPLYPRAEFYVKIWYEFDSDTYLLAYETFPKHYEKLSTEEKQSPREVWDMAVGFALAEGVEEEKNISDSLKLRRKIWRNLKPESPDHKTDWQIFKEGFEKPPTPGTRFLVAAFPYYMILFIIMGIIIILFN